MHLRLLLISDLLVHKKNVIKHHQGLADESCTSVLSWPSSVPCKRDITHWKSFISIISKSDGSLLSPLHWSHDTQRHRRSVAFISEDNISVQIIYEGQPKVYKWTWLHNRYLLTTAIENVAHKDRVEVELQKNRCKVFDACPLIQIGKPIRNHDIAMNQQSLTTWSADDNATQHMLLSNRFSAMIDGSFFPEHPEFISAHWKFIRQNKIIGKGGFAAIVEPYLQSAHAAEVHGGLGVLSSMKQIMDSFNQEKKVDLLLGIDC